MTRLALNRGDFRKPHQHALHQWAPRTVALHQIALGNLVGQPAGATIARDCEEQPVGIGGLGFAGALRGADVSPTK